MIGRYRNTFIIIIIIIIIIFNVFYEDLIDNISHSDRGISLRGETYNVFCYADDLLITSTTVSGLQSLIDMCDSYMPTRTTVQP